VPTPEEIAERAELYRRRAGHYYENWDGIYEQWKAKVTAKFDEHGGLVDGPRCWSQAASGADAALSSLRSGPLAHV
jgi:hypothetical protein